VGLFMVVLLIILPAQCNARAGPYNFMERAKHDFAIKEEKAAHISDHKQVIPSNQSAGDCDAGVVPSKSRIGISLSLLAKGTPLPPFLR